ncbi:MAG: SusC/RagA family TonB-linked outer membrane protein, partial [Massilibacteroides sp.]|nr:SusC/RagA family TonB-linked outer membrane protein [Massilibacteroides sp.]
MKMRVLFTVLSGLKERMKDRWYILLLVTLLFSLNGYAQSRSQARSNAKKITGYVVDATGEPLTGVAIKILTGASKGTVTDIDGQFILDVNEGVPLEFSYLGYKTQTVNAKNDMRVIMSEAVEELEEVIVVGYGTMKKSDLTGSISSISSDDFHMQPIMNTTDALMGRLSGVMVSNTSGNVDGSVKIRIRGANSINGGNDPLYVCDGVVGSDIPPADAIESIEVLKDASATAIYGSRGANGVILITTKKGKVGKTTVTVNAFGSYAAPSNLYDMVDAYTYAQQINLINNNPYSESQLEYFKQNGGTDWQKEILKSAWRQKYNVAVDGGTSKVRYHILGEYSNNTSLIEGQRSEKYMVRSNFDIELYKNLSLEWHVNGFYKQNRNIGGSLYEGGADAILFNALTWGPTENIYESDGSYNLADQFGAMGDNPVLKMKGTDKWGKFFGVSSNAALTWQVLPELSIQYRLNIDLSNSNNYEWESADYTLSYASSSGSKSLTSNIFQNLIVNWNKSFDKHNIGVTFVGESNKYTSDGLSGRGSYFGNENLGYWGMSTGTSKEASTSWSDYALLSGIGRATYNYGGKYYATMTFRADGSSKFAKGNKWGYFPSGSLAWRLSEEQFIKDLNVFSNLKMRASYGKTGNQGVGPYSTIASLSRVGAYYTYTSKVQGYTSKVVNKNLQWEETGQFDLGLDIGLLNDRLNFTLDYYKKKTDKLLLNIATPYFLGGDNIYMNKGKV